MIPLSELNAGARGIVAEITADSAETERLSQLGIVPGAAVEVRMRGSGGSPVAFAVHGAVLALRRESCEQIHIALTGGQMTFLLLHVDHTAAFPPALTRAEEQELLEQMKKYLPNYMLPKKFIRIDDFSVTTNGKLDRKALIVPEEDENTSSVSAEFTDTERKLSKIWESNLDVKVGSSSDDYFELGGNSLKATNMLYDIEEVFLIKFKIGMIFRYSSLHDMAAQIDKLRKEN